MPPATSPPTANDVDAVLSETAPSEPLSLAGAQVRLAEIQAHIAAIGWRIEDRSRRVTPAWRKAALQAREALREEARELRAFVAEEDGRCARAAAADRAVRDVVRQEVDRATREARKATPRGQRALWDVYLKVEVTLRAIAHGGGRLGPLGESLLYTAGEVVPDWYRARWMQAEFATTWGQQAAVHRVGRGLAPAEPKADAGPDDRGQ